MLQSWTVNYCRDYHTLTRKAKEEISKTADTFRRVGQESRGLLQPELPKPGAGGACAGALLLLRHESKSSSRTYSLKHPSRG